MKRLVTAAAALGASQADCKNKDEDKPTTMYDAIPAPARDASSADAAPTDASIDATTVDASIDGGAEAGADGGDAGKKKAATLPACAPGQRRLADGSCAYMVVDPIPTPSRGVDDR